MIESEYNHSSKSLIRGKYFSYSMYLLVALALTTVGVFAGQVINLSYPLLLLVFVHILLLEKEQ